MQCVSLPGPWETQARSGAGGHGGGENVVRVAVQILASPVIAHRGAWVGVPGDDLDIPQAGACVEHGRYERVPEPVRMCPGSLDAGGCGEPAQAAGGRVPVHPGASAVEQDRPMSAVGDGPVNGPADCWRQRNQDDFGAFPAHAQHPVAALLAQVGDVRAGGFEDPQAKKAEHGHQREVARIG